MHFQSLVIEYNKVQFLENTVLELQLIRKFLNGLSILSFNGKSPPRVSTTLFNIFFKDDFSLSAQSENSEDI